MTHTQQERITYIVDYYDNAGKLRTVEITTNDERLIPFIINDSAKRRKDRLDKIARVAIKEAPMKKIVENVFEAFHRNLIRQYIESGDFIDRELIFEECCQICDIDRKSFDVLMNKEIYACAEQYRTEKGK